METERFETDVLCVGGGIAALMAAIRAAEYGIKVIVADKGNTLSSGAGGSGNDHFLCYIPEFHGDDIGKAVRSVMLGQMGSTIQMLGPAQTLSWFKKSYEIVKLWNEWGIPMKASGKWKFAGHCFPGHINCWLKYFGKNQKKILTKEACKRGVHIMNRKMVVDLLGDENGVAGALAIDTRDNKLIEIQAKSILLATGLMRRLFPSATPAVFNNDTHPLTLTGDGRAMAYRVGAELANVEMLVTTVGVKYFLRAGQGSWIGVYRYPNGNPIGPYVTKPEVDYGDVFPEVDKDIFGRIIESGRGPIFMDFTGITQEEIGFMYRSLESEGNAALVNHFEEEGIDPMKHALEFWTHGVYGGGQIWRNEKTETNVKGLYVAGDDATRGISAAAVFSWNAGENMAEHAKQESSQSRSQFQNIIEGKKDLINSLTKNKKGYGWMDANIALNQVMNDYAGLAMRSESMLESGLRHLRRLKTKLNSSLMAKDHFELIRCLEVLNLYQMGELVFLGALGRKESRGPHNRVDYPYTDPLLNGKVQYIKKVEEKPVSDWRTLPHAP